VIVFDSSALVGAAIRRDGVPELALRHAFQRDRIAVSEAVMAELLDVFARPRLQRFLDPALRGELLSTLLASGVFFEPAERVTDCRDPKDNIYLELALASGADTIVSSDQDLLVLHPWRGVRVLRPAEYLAQTIGGA
jgi:putative PIN family toxin of toxin-antitoxin system